MSILLADDDAPLATFLSKSLESAGYSVHTALDEESVLQELKKQNYQLIILDLNFGQTDGLTLLERLRSQGLETPVMVLSARNRVTDRIQSLNVGADDYVTKPFSFQELAARANALLRRKTDPALTILRFQDLELDPATRKVNRGKREIKLSPKEFDMLHLLMRRSGATVSRQDLLRECWGQELETDSNLVDVYVNYLRKKVELSEDDKLIHTVRGAGYRLGKPKSAGSPSAEDEAESEASFEGELAAEDERIPQRGDAGETPLREALHSVAHDLAQPLTSLRCFLEVLAMSNVLKEKQAQDLKEIEQQADRAIALAKGISALAREDQNSTQPSISLDTLIGDVLNHFSVLLHSGLLELQREGSAYVTSSSILRHVLVLLFSKLVGRNARPLHLDITTKVNDGRCEIRFRWKANDSARTTIAAAMDILARDMSTLQEMCSAIGGEILLQEAQPEFSLFLPLLPAPKKKARMVH